MKDRRIRYEDIEYAIVDNGRLYVLGERYHQMLRNTYFNIVCNASTGEILKENIFKRYDKLLRRKRKDREYLARQSELEEFCMKRLKESVKDIKVYQGSIDEVSKDLGEELERVDTGEPETFIRAYSDIDRNLKLRLIAKKLGADAIVHYQPESFVGTPVKFVDKKNE